MRSNLAGPRLLLRRLREVMAEPITAQERLDKIVVLIASNVVAEVCSVYILRDGRFELLGRTDTIVKIEEKRISLAEVEQLILLSDWVCQCKLVVLQGGRTQLGAVVQLTDAGAAMLAEKGKFTLTQQLRGMLAKYLERVVIPRKWRFVAKLPYNSQGKLTQQDLAALFET